MVEDERHFINSLSSKPELKKNQAIEIIKRYL